MEPGVKVWWAAEVWWVMEPGDRAEGGDGAVSKSVAGDGVYM